MNKLKLHRLTLFEIGTYAMDLLIVSDGNEIHVQDPKVRIAWHWFFSSFIFIAIFSLFIKPVLTTYFADSLIATGVYRFCILLFYIYLTVILFVLVFLFYNRLLKTSKDLRLSNILFFYFAGILLFSHIYQALYIFQPSSFIIVNPIFVPEPYLMDRSSFSYWSQLDFIAYSANTIVTQTYNRIQSGSILVSFLNLIGRIQLASATVGFIPKNT